MSQWKLGEWNNERCNIWRLSTVGVEPWDDTMAEIRQIGLQRWQICWWAAPRTPGSIQTMDFEGTLEEAKAVAIAQVKM